MAIARERPRHARQVAQAADAAGSAGAARPRNAMDDVGIEADAQHETEATRALRGRRTAAWPRGMDWPRRQSRAALTPMRYCAGFRGAPSVWGFGGHLGAPIQEVPRMQFEVEVYRNDVGEWVATAVEYKVSVKGRTE